MPIYTPSWPGDQFPAIAVDGYPMPVWVIGINEFVGADGRLAGHCEQLVDAVAYWLHEMSPRLSHHFASTTNAAPLEIVIQLEQTEQWFHDLEPFDSANSESLVVAKTDETTGAVMLAFRPASTSLNSSEDNSGERVLLRHTLKAIATCLESTGLTLTPGAVDALIDWAAPVGMKRKI